VPREGSDDARGSARLPSVGATIGDYAVIGDCRTAALVSRSGEIGWWCAPHFSSPSIFGSLLDVERGGRFQVSAAEPSESRRRYRDGSNILETTFTTPTGSFRLIDSMPLPCGSAELRPMREILRGLVGLDGEVHVRIEVSPRPDYARTVARLHQRGRNLWAWSWGSNLLMLHSDVELAADGSSLSGEMVLKAGQSRWLSLSYEQGEVGVVPGLGRVAEKRLTETDAWWRQWSHRARYEGPHRDAVVRSALALKLLCSAQSGAVVAAATTSVPEWPGADRNWDYRYCWLRDAALTMRAFTGLGYIDEGRAFLDWLLHATRLTWPRLQVLYDIYGRTDLREDELRHWRGFRDSKPVRIGNAARTQLQLDIYGAVCFAARNFVEATGNLQRDEARLLRGFGDEVCRQWQQPDHGIWEVRGKRRCYTFSRIMCWAALDSLLRLEASGHMRLRPHVAAAAPAIRDSIEIHGYNSRVRSYVAVFDGDQADGSLLLAGCLGYRDPRHERMRGTFDYVHRKLARNGLLYRYEPGSDGFSSPEGAFAICSFFAIDHLAKRCEHAKAWEAFHHVLSFANDVGLFAEEIDPDSGELLGNFPQAYTHVGLINGALGLTAAESA
jgi:GH15 family glucan-1,4-alpha-glucosidase